MELSGILTGVKEIANGAVENANKEKVMAETVSIICKWAEYLGGFFVE